MKRFIFFILLSICGIYACTNLNQNVTLDEEGAESGVRIYALKSFITERNSQKIDETSVVLADKVLVDYEDIVTYNIHTHDFTLTDKGKKAILDLENGGIRKAFAVKAQNSVIYTGYFWSSTMSSDCNWAIMDVIDLPSDNKLKVRLGYPNELYKDGILDRRLDKRLFDILKNDNKLVH
jgi:hypothetical protein